MGLDSHSCLKIGLSGVGSRQTPSDVTVWQLRAARENCRDFPDHSMTLQERSRISLHQLFTPNGLVVYCEPNMTIILLITLVLLVRIAFARMLIPSRCDQFSPSRSYKQLCMRTLAFSSCGWAFVRPMLFVLLYVVRFSRR